MNRLTRPSAITWIASILGIWILAACVAPEALLVQPADSNTVPQATIAAEATPEYYYTKSEAAYLHTTVLENQCF